jgi:hypothetical protein
MANSFRKTRKSDSMFKRKIVPFLLAIAASSCATIVSRSSYNVRLASSPDDAKVQVVDRKGNEIFNGTTPTQVVLKSGAGYFKKAIYIIRYTKAGFLQKEVTINSDVNGWYFGNLVFGGIIGFLIVDPITGAMYKLDRTELNETLAADKRTGGKQERTLEIVNIDQIPSAMRNRLVELK